ncbi:ATP-binding protein [Thalassotalea marina]|uniref:histidine kinase n=1 Tax=Thalassotalea marina TaxID=1673741 RepID=A0A919BPZ8_9GAMM|nr:ATP-binding protein [Thalassotalea marina]GHG05452.1 hypothetical protein GCM10017161_38830 [Thalassotalea marina]
MLKGVYDRLLNAERIKLPILFTFILILAITFFVTIYSTTHFANVVLKDNIERQFQEVTSFYQKEIASQKAVQALINFSLSENERIKALLAGERKTFEEVHSIYRYLNDHQNVTHFYLVSAQRKVLYRAHQPERFGDIVNRHTMLASEQSMQTVSGLEFGVLGTFTLRTVSPIFDRGTLLGYIEVGMEIGHVLRQIENQFQVNIFELFEQSLVPEENSNQVYQMTGRKNELNLLPNYSINYDASITLDQHKVEQIHRAIEGEVDLEKGLAASTTIIANFNGDHIGYQVVLMNIENLISEHNKQIKIISAIYATTLVIGIAIFAFILSVAENTVKRFIKQKRQDNELISKNMQELQAAQQQLVEKEKLASLGNVVAGVAHEVNTPIGVAVTVATTIESHISRFIEDIKSGKLKRSALGDFEDNCQECLHVLVPALEKASTLINSFKQVAVDQTSEARRLFLLHEVVDEVIITLKHKVKNRAIDIEVNIANDIELDSYPGPLGQVITNLFNNAVNHAFDVVDAGKITIRACQDEATVSITVSDNGQGIAPENLSKIFDPFYTTKLGQGGSGLGLNIVYNTVVGALAGKIQVASKLNEGTTFTLTLPLSLPKDSKNNE